MTRLLVLGLLTPFVLAFVYAGIHEYRRLRREGPVEDWRETFEFDEDAPGYEEPESAPDGDEDTGEHPETTEPDDAGSPPPPEIDRKDKT